MPVVPLGLTYQKTLKFDSSTRALMCPVCDGNNLHQRWVTIYDRAECGAKTLVTHVGDDGVRSELRASEGLHNPSAERQGLIIQFDCESCSSHARLCVWQHEGSTLMEWAREPAGRGFWCDQDKPFDL